MKANRKTLAVLLSVLMLLFLPLDSVGSITYFNPTNFVVERGTLIAGNLTDLQPGNPGIMNIAENNGPDPLTVRFDFTGLPTTLTKIRIDSYQRYAGSPTHTLLVRAYNFSSSTWVSYNTITSSSSFEWKNTSISDKISDFISDGNFSMQIFHLQPGNQNHNYYIDTLILNTEECEPPTFNQISASSTVAGTTCIFSANISGQSGLSGYIFSTNNTGSWKNDTWTPLTTNPAWANVTKTLNSTVGNVVGYLWYSNCSANSWGKSSTSWITTVEFILTIQTPTHSWNIAAGQNNILINQEAISIVVSAARTYKIQVKGNGPLTYGDYSISLGNVRCSKDTLGSAIPLTTNYQDVPGLTGLPAGTDMLNTFKLWLSTPLGTHTGDYTYTLSIQIV